MDTNKYIAAIDLGTSKIIGLIGSKNEEGLLNIIAIETEEAGGSIKRGCIQNVEEVASRVKRIITKLENRIPQKITQIYVGLAGQSIHTIDHKVYRQLQEDSPIDEALINSMISESQSFPVFNAEIMDIFPNEYIIDSKPETHPISIFGSEIYANLKLVTGRPSLKKNLYRCLVERVRIPIAGYIIGAKATAAALLADEEKKLGCALIDFGGGTTTLSIYKDNYLRFIVTIPFGGRNITKDISSLNVLETEAEKMKIIYGNAIGTNNPDPKVVHQVESAKVKYQTFCRVVEARIEEIVQNIIAQIDESGYAKQLSAGIIITGGASQLKDLPELLKQKTGMDVRKGTLVKNITFSNKSEKIDHGYTLAIGLLLLGEDTCVKEREPESVKETQQSTKEIKKKSDDSPKKSGLWWEKVKRKAEGLFDDDNDTPLS